MLIVGSFVPVNKAITESFPVFLASGMRLGLGFVLLLPLVWRRVGHFPRLALRDHGVLFAQSFFGVFLFSILLLVGLKQTSALEGSIIMGTTPVVIGLLSVILFKERFSMQQGFAVGTAIAGTLLIQVFGASGHGGGASGTWIGNLLVFGAVVGEAIFMTFGKLVAKGTPPMVIALFTSMYGTLLFLPFAIWEAMTFSFTKASTVDWALILYSGAIVTALAVVLMNMGTSKLPAMTAGVFSALMPLSAVLISALFLHEPLQFYHIGGLMLIITGVMLTLRQPAVPVPAPAVPAPVPTPSSTNHWKGG
nr:DMT family transporter [Paenibacillus turpanensis]